MDLGVEIGADHGGGRGGVDHRAVRIGVQDGDAGALKSGDHLVMVTLRRPEAGGKLIGGEELVVLWVLWRTRQAPCCTTRSSSAALSR